MHVANKTAREAKTGINAVYKKEACFLKVEVSPRLHWLLFVIGFIRLDKINAGRLLNPCLGAACAQYSWRNTVLPPKQKPELD